MKSGELLFAEELRKQLDDYVAGKVVLLLDFCYSGIYLKEHIGIDKVFVKEFVEAGTGVKALSKNGKYKIMTSSNQNISVGGEVVSAATGYWAKGMGFTEPGTQSILYADAMSEDEFGNQCFGNNDGEVTLEELYKYASPMIYEELYFRRAGENNYPQRYPENDNFVIYKR